MTEKRESAPIARIMTPSVLPHPAGAEEPVPKGVTPGWNEHRQNNPPHKNIQQGNFQTDKSQPQKAVDAGALNKGGIVFKGLWYRYPRTKEWSLKDVNVSIKPGEFVAVIGENGAGKTTFCKCLNGIIPHTERGRFKGQVLCSNLDTKTAYTSELALHVGMVLEDPDTQLFTTTVLNEIAFGPENLQQDPAEIIKTAKWALNVVGLTGFESRPPTALSGGQKQRVVIAAVLAMRPEIIVLDEPTSQLDPLGTEEVFEVIQKLRDTYGLTIVMATHKMEEVIRFADKVLVLHHGEAAAFDTPRAVFQNEELFKQIEVDVPAFIELSSYLKKRDIPVKVFTTLEAGAAELRRLLKNGGHKNGKNENGGQSSYQSSYPYQSSHQSLKESLKESLKAKDEQISTRRYPLQSPAQGQGRERSDKQSDNQGDKEPVISIQDLYCNYDRSAAAALRDIQLEIFRNQFVGIIGQNGAGKSTLLKHMIGLIKPKKGQVRVLGNDPGSMSVSKMARQVGFVLQNPDLQLFAHTVGEEVEFGPLNMGIKGPELETRVRQALVKVGLEDQLETYPLTLSKGDRSKVVIASVLAMDPEIIVLDEPTCGQDHRGNYQIMEITKNLQKEGKTIVVVTHNMGLIAKYAERIIVLKNGSVFMDGSVKEVFAQPDKLLETHIKPPYITRLGQAAADCLAGEAIFLSVKELGDEVVRGFSTSGGHTT